MECGGTTFCSRPWCSFLRLRPHHFPCETAISGCTFAAGRLLANGEYAFGHDPFAYTTENVYWANHSWLFDLTLYAGFQAIGGNALVVLKALGVVILVAIMLRIARSEGPFWISGASITLAVLAMSPGLLLQPMLISLLLLALCLYLIVRGGVRHLIAGEGERPTRLLVSLAGIRPRRTNGRRDADEPGLGNLSFRMFGCAMVRPSECFAV